MFSFCLKVNVQGLHTSQWWPVFVLIRCICKIRRLSSDLFRYWHESVRKWYPLWHFNGHWVGHSKGGHLLQCHEVALDQIWKCLSMFRSQTEFWSKMSSILLPIPKLIWLALISLGLCFRLPKVCHLLTKQPALCESLCEASYRHKIHAKIFCGLPPVRLTSAWPFSQHCYPD